MTSHGLATSIRTTVLQLPMPVIDRRNLLRFLEPEAQEIQALPATQPPTVVERGHDANTGESRVKDDASQDPEWGEITSVSPSIATRRKILN